MKRTIKALAAAALLSAAMLATGGEAANAVPTLGNMSRIETGTSGAQQVHWRRWHHCHRVCGRHRCWRECHGGHRGW